MGEGWHGESEGCSWRRRCESPRAAMGAENEIDCFHYAKKLLFLGLIFLTSATGANK